MEIASALKTGAEAVGLASSLAKLIKETKDTEINKDLTGVLRRVQIDAIRLSRDIENKLRNLSDQIGDYGLNPGKSLNQQFENLSWYNFVTRSRLKSLREECHSIYRQLTSFMDDVTAVLICANQQQLASEAFKSGFEAKRDLDRLFLDPNISLGTMIDAMLATATRVTADLSAA
jgi:hypothetical protein